MKERPILFSAPMVRAILEGRKTQTRRVVKWAGRDYSQYENLAAVFQENYPHAHAGETTGIGIPSEGGVVQIMGKCPYGKPGDRLWVRESFGFSHQADDVNCREQVIVYRTGHPYGITDAGVDELKRCKDGSMMEPNHFVSKPLLWRPSIHMPRWASRITLEIVSVRVERLQDISASDARAEGVPCSSWSEDDWVDSDGYPTCADQREQQAICEYAELWESINGKTHPWESNPWVWVIEFKVMR